MLLPWAKKRRRARLAAEPFPAAWEGFLGENVRCWRVLDDAHRQALKRLVRVFVHEKRWEGCANLQVTDEIKITIASQACLLLLGIEHDYFPNVTTILVYPAGYVAPPPPLIEADDLVVQEDEGEMSGEAHYDGPVLLSWDEALAGARGEDDGCNLVLHEFAHKLDMLDGVIDGTPPLASAEQLRDFSAVMSEEFARLRRRAERGRPTLLDQYGAQDAAEFFAVGTECFFERPRQLLRAHPELYRVLKDYYGQDPAQWGG